METEPPSNPQDLTAFVTDLLEQMRAARVREPAVTALGFPAPTPSTRRGVARVALRQEPVITGEGPLVERGRN